MEHCWIVEWRFRNQKGAKWMASLWVTIKQIAMDYIAERCRENPDIEYRLREDRG